jgi:hypothetical protein
MQRTLPAALAMVVMQAACAGHESAGRAGAPPLGGDGGVYNNQKLPGLTGLGLFGVEVVFADLDGDTYPDLVTSSGAMASPQPLVVYKNTRAQQPFLNRPSWYSGNIAHRGALAVGDLDADGLPDLVVPVLYDNAATPGSGRVEVFLNSKDCGLPLQPSYVLSLPETPLSAALGDVDGDGDLDLAVASVGPALPGGGAQAVAQRVYFNRDRSLRTEESWTGPALAAVSLLFADLDQDGWLDLVIGGSTVAIVHGGASTFSSAWEGNTSWLKTSFSAAYGLSAGRIGARAGLSLVIADNCRRPDGECDTGLWLFPPDDKGLPAQSGTLIRQLANGSRVRILDGNNDGNPDLVVSQLGKLEQGAPLLLLEGRGDGASFGASFETPPFLGVGIAIGDPLLKAAKSDSFVVRGFHGSVITLPRQHIDRVMSVSLDGRKLDPKALAWIPGANWVGLGTPPPGEHTVQIEYVWSPKQTLAIASHDPRDGPRLMYSRYRDAP